MIPPKKVSLQIRQGLNNVVKQSFHGGSGLKVAANELSIGKYDINNDRILVYIISPTGNLARGLYRGAASHIVIFNPSNLGPHSIGFYSFQPYRNYMFDTYRNYTAVMTIWCYNGIVYDYETTRALIKLDWKILYHES